MPYIVINFFSNLGNNSSVVSVRWSSNIGEGGTADGTTIWTISDISLSIGENKITVTAIDGAGNTATDAIVIIYTDNTNTSNNDITTGLVGHWFFDGGTAIGNSGNGHDGTINDAVSQPT
ncbi:MAG: hypothetical protein E3K37_04830 [Candidatus Kuenenia sp.]|nr:hypothetical protein [Candidatus Kuenenia hertensis]